MKTALFLSDWFPPLEDSRFLDFVHEHDLDIFCTVSISNRVPYWFLNHLKRCHVHTLRLQDLFPKSIPFLDILPRHTGTVPFQLLSYFYGLSKDFEMLRDHEKRNNVQYDKILHVHEKGVDSLYQFHEISVVPSRIYCPKDIHASRLMVFGTKQTMQRYCELFDYIAMYVGKGVCFHYNSLIYTHCMEMRIGIESF